MCSRTVSCHNPNNFVICSMSVRSKILKENVHVPFHIATIPHRYWQCRKNRLLAVVASWVDSWYVDSTSRLSILSNGTGTGISSDVQIMAGHNKYQSDGYTKAIIIVVPYIIPWLFYRNDSSIVLFIFNTVLENLGTLSILCSKYFPDFHDRWRWRK